MERVWFDKAITCRSRTEIGILAPPDESFILDDGDTIASIQTEHDEAREASRCAASTLGRTTVSGPRFLPHSALPMSLR